MVLKWRVRIVKEADELYILVGKRVRQLRLQRCPTQEQLAESEDASGFPTPRM